ncbi:MAG: NTP transferase domain-containing protein [Deltaproteobacteria bacterium]|nr:NTP transferase domain-containing protein [Deltaproteobacteria bacterium]MBI4223729.1 NTP transferase domain-containing protein [Deltaproteobacteria bacterium]
MKAILLTAGQGSRLLPYTQSMPKHLLPLGSTTIIHRTIKILRDIGIQDIAMVVGYLKEKFYEAFPKDIQFYTNEAYPVTDQAASLAKAVEKLEDDFLVIAGDLFCPRKVFVQILEKPHPICLAIEKRKGPFNDVTEKVCTRGESIFKIGKLNVLNGEANGEFLGLTKVRKEKASFFLRHLKAALLENPRSAIIHVHQKIIDAGCPLPYIHCGDSWCEIDEPATWKKAKEIFQKTPDY